MAGTTIARVPRLGSTVTLYPAFFRTSAQMFDTMACSSKLVEPMMMVGLLLDAPPETAGTTNVAAAAARTPEMKTRVNRMSHPLLCYVGETTRTPNESQPDCNRTVECLQRVTSCIRIVKY